MATTQIADVIVPEVYDSYVVQKTTALNAVINSGIATRDAGLVFPDTSRQVKGGKTIHIPFWKSLIQDTSDDEDEVLSDSTALTPNALSAGESVAVVNCRGKAWGVNDLARYFAGDDPMGAIGDMNAAYWANRFQNVLVKSLEGITVGTNAALKDHVLDITAQTGGADVLSSGAMIDAIYKLGDHASLLSGLMMHSAVAGKLAKLNLISTVRDADGKVLYDEYFGKRVIVDDALKPEDADGKNFPIYFFAEGAIAFNEDTNGLILTETERDKFGGNDYLISRRAFVMHPRGLKWVGTPAGATPTNAELATATNWELADNLKNIPITKLLCHIA